jgi:hypothetical protein
MSFIFNEKYSYPYNEILKKHNGKFNPDTKLWSLPIQNKKLFMTDKLALDLQKQEIARLAWADACSDLGHKYVKKETPEYYEVKELFKLKMKGLN